MLPLSEDIQIFDLFETEYSIPNVSNAFSALSRMATAYHRRTEDKAKIQGRNFAYLCCFNSKNRSAEEQRLVEKSFKYTGTETGTTMWAKIKDERKR